MKPQLFDYVIKAVPGVDWFGQDCCDLDNAGELQVLRRERRSLWLAVKTRTRMPGNPFMHYFFFANYCYCYNFNLYFTRTNKFPKNKTDLNTTKKKPVVRIQTGFLPAFVLFALLLQRPITWVNVTILSQLN